MKLQELDAITSGTYGFHVFNWDNNRGNSGGAGDCLVAKYDFVGRHEHLSKCTATETAEIFSKIFAANKNVEINNKSFTAISVHIRTGVAGDVPDQPSLFILGFQTGIVG